MKYKEKPSCNKCSFNEDSCTIPFILEWCFNCFCVLKPCLTLVWQKVSSNVLMLPTWFYKLNFRAKSVPSPCQLDIIIHFKPFEEMALYQRFKRFCSKTIHAISSKVNQVRDGRFNRLISKSNSFESTSSEFFLFFAMYSIMKIHFKSTSLLQRSTTIDLYWCYWLGRSRQPVPIRHNCKQ